MGMNETNAQTEPGIDGQPEEEFSYKGYEVVDSRFFSHLFEPTVKLGKETVSVNASCIRKLPDTEYVQFLVNREEKKLAIEPCTEEDKDSFRWASVGKDGKLRPKIISCKPFFDRVMKLMEWDPGKRYRIVGKLIRANPHPVFVFNLNKVEMVGIKGSRSKSYPTDLNENFGTPAEEHQKEDLISLFKEDAVFYLEKEDASEKLATDTDALVVANTEGEVVE